MDCRVGTVSRVGNCGGEERESARYEFNFSDESDSDGEDDKGKEGEEEGAEDLEEDEIERLRLGRQGGIDGSGDTSEYYTKPQKTLQKQSKHFTKT